MRFSIIISWCILFFCCNDAASDQKLDFIRQFNETIKSLELQNEYIFHEFDVGKDESPNKIRPWYEHLMLVKRNKIKLDYFFDSLLVKGDTILINKILAFKSLRSSESSRNIKLNEKDFVNIKTKLSNFKDVIMPKFTKDDRLKNLDKYINEILSIEKLGNLNVSNKGLSTIDYLSIIYKLKSDITLAESIIINYLLSQVDFSSFRFHRIEIIVKPDCQVLPVGFPYKAYIFPAIIDTTKSYSFEIDGNLYKTHKNKGFYSFKVNENPGIYKKSGTFFKVRPYDSTIQKIPFKIEYEVLEKK